MEIFTDEPNQDSPQLYNALDTCITAEVFENLSSLIPQAQPIYNFELALQAPVIEMQLRGIKIDTFKLGDMVSKLKRNRGITEEILKKFVAACWDRPWEYSAKGRPTFIESNKQLIEFFYDTLGLKRITKSHKGEIKTPMDRDVLEKLSIHFQTRPIVSCLLASRDATKKLEFLEVGIDPDSRIRCSINIGGASTGRFSTSQSTTGSGTNLQNITEDLRHLLISDPGCKIAGIDKSQAESREVGYFCGIMFGDWSYLDAVESGDIHTYVARLIWKNLPWTGDLKKDRLIADQKFYLHYSYRDFAKCCGHGTNYLGQPYQISMMYKLAQNDVKNFQEEYLVRAFPCIRKMHYWVKEQLQTKGYLVNIFGRRRDFFDRHDSNETLKQAVAFLFQSATADDLNLGLWRIWKYFPKAQLLLQLHDAIYFQFAESENEEEIIRTAQKLMDVKFTHKNRDFIVPTEALTGYNLGHRYKRDEKGKKQDVNPRGLDEVKFSYAAAA